MGRLMAIKTSDVKVGDILHDVHTERMGNTTMRREGHWTARVTEVAEDGSWAMASWNGNPAKRYRNQFPTSWKRTPKEWLRNDLHGRRCSMCSASERDGHDPDCEHPRAVAARNRDAKAPDEQRVLELESDP
jgi:hypothetical protein